MSSTLERVVIRGNTFRITNIITDFDGSPLDPDSQAIRLLKPDETQEGVDWVTPTKNGVGDYHQNVTVPVDGVEGEWKAEWEIMVGTELSTKRISFRVVA